MLDQDQDDLEAKAMELATTFNFDVEDMGHAYDQMSPDEYEAWMRAVRFTERDEIIKDCLRILPEIGLDAQIFDIGAGTGIVGQEICSAGYKNIDAVDASERMLSKSRDRNCYRNIHHMYLGNGSFPKSEMLGTYDLIITSGVWLDGHIPREGISESIACLRQGGHWVTAMRTKFMEPTEPKGYYTKMQELEEQGVIQKLEMRKFMRGVKGDDITPIMKEQESTLFIYKKV